MKATLHPLDDRTPGDESYRFQIREAGKTSQQQADEIEVENKCLIYHARGQCLEGGRYEITTYPETTSPDSTRFVPRVDLTPGAPPCGLCWDKINRESDIRKLVDRLTQYDFQSTATVKITGENREFQDAVIAACIESDCEADVSTVKGIVRQAIDIRRLQLDALPTDRRVEWSQQLTSEFLSTLRAYIGKKPE